MVGARAAEAVIATHVENAIGLYELSRRREQGLDTSWKHAFDIVHSPSIWAIVGLGLLDRFWIDREDQCLHRRAFPAR